MGLGTGTSGSTNAGLWFSGNTLYFYANGQGSVTTQLFRDFGWYHILGSWKLDESGTAKGKLFVNGSEVTSFSDDRRSSWGTTFGSTATQSVGSVFDTTMFTGYIAQPIMLDGQSVQGGDVAITDFVDTFTFGTNGSQIIPKKDSEVAALAGTAGGNSFCLDFANSGDLGNDISGNNKDLTTSMGTDHQSSNTPSLVYPVMNPLDKHSAATLSNGGLRYSSSSTTYHGVRSTFFITDSTPKIYWEATYTAGGGSSTDNIGLADFEYALGQTYGVNGTAVFATTTKGSTAYFKNETATPHSEVSYDVDVGDVMRFAYDPSTKKFWVGNVTNDTYLGGGNPATDSTPTATLTIEHPCSPLAGRFGSLGTTTFDFNFGQTAFTGTVPTGFVALNSSTLTAPTHQGCDAFSTVTYTGNGSTRSITTDIAPAWVWIKNRSQADEHKLVDIVRGATKELSSDDASNSEQTDSNGVTAFGSSSFSLGSGAAGYNDNTENFIAWCWAAGTAFSNDASATGIGTLDSSGRVNASDSLSIISYTGNNTDNASFKHGLSGAPELVIHRERDNSNGWLVGATVVGYDQMLRLDTADGDTADADAWSDVAPNSSIITLGAGNGTNRAGAMICYAMRSVSGVCKIGSYVGNGSATAGPYISLGFRPRWIMVKNVSVARDWVVVDTARTASNPAELFLFPNVNNAEAANGPASGSTYDFDLLADGFRPLTGDSAPNGSGNTILYAAFSDIAGNGTLPPIYGR